MRKLVDLEIVYKMDILIRGRVTGNPKAFAERLGISHTTLFDIISHLREDMRAPIVYNKHGKTYEYEYPPRFHIGFDEGQIPFGALHLSNEGSRNGAGDGHSEDSNSDMIEDEMDAEELNEIYRGREEDDSDDDRLDDDINFNDLFPYD